MNLDDKRIWTINILKEGGKSEYWSILEGQIDVWIKREKGIIESYSVNGIKTDEEKTKFNSAIMRLDYLRNFKTINEDIINYNDSFLRKVKDKIEDTFIETASFVKSYTEGLFK